MITMRTILNAGSTLFLLAALTQCEGSGTDTGMSETQDLGAPAIDMTAPDIDRAVDPAPVLTAISPATASNSGGATLTLTGTGFLPGATVSIGGAPCASPIVTSTQIRCTVPRRSRFCGGTQVLITNPDQQSTRNGPTTPFSYHTSVVSFESPLNLPAGSGSFYVLSQDLDGDGAIDLASSNLSGSVSVYLGNGDGSFRSLTTLAAAGQCWGLAAQDMDGDGKLDLVTDCGGNLYVYRQSGSGMFAAGISYPGGSDRGLFALGDLNGDGQPDAVTSSLTKYQVNVVLGIAGGGFLSPVSLLTTGTTTGIALADLNGDGKLDLVYSNQTAASISVRIGLGNGVFGSAVDYSVEAGTSPLGLMVADLSADSKPDVAVCNGGGVSTFLNDGAGSLGTATLFPTGGQAPQSPLVTDLNRDGVLDILAPNANSGSWTYLEGLGNNRYAIALTTPAATPKGISAADFNNDKLPDVAVSISPGNLLVYIQQCN